jgi:hypothetical protein
MRKKGDGGERERERERETRKNILKFSHIQSKLEERRFLEQVGNYNLGCSQCN